MAGKVADACYTKLFIAPFRVQRYKIHISKMLEKNEDRVNMIKPRISADLHNHLAPEHEAGRRWLEQYRS